MTITKELADAGFLFLPTTEHSGIAYVDDKNLGIRVPFKASEDYLQGWTIHSVTTRSELKAPKKITHTADDDDFSTFAQATKIGRQKIVDGIALAVDVAYNGVILRRVVTAGIRAVTLPPRALLDVINP